MTKPVYMNFRLRSKSNLVWFCVALTNIWVALTCFWSADNKLRCCFSELLWPASKVLALLSHSQWLVWYKKANRSKQISMFTSYKAGYRWADIFTKTLPHSVQATQVSWVDSFLLNSYFPACWIIGSDNRTLEVFVIITNNYKPPDLFFSWHWGWG